MTAPQPGVTLAANTEVRQDSQGNVVVILRMMCGLISTEFAIAPGDAERFGEGIAAGLKQAGEQAKTLQPGLVVPPKGLIIPRLNGGAPQ